MAFVINGSSARTCSPSTRSGRAPRPWSSSRIGATPARQRDAFITRVSQLFILERFRSAFPWNSQERERKRKCGWFAHRSWNDDLFFDPLDNTRVVISIDLASFGFLPPPFCQCLRGRIVLNETRRDLTVVNNPSDVQKHDTQLGYILNLFADWQGAFSSFMVWAGHRSTGAYLCSCLCVCVCVIIFPAVNDQTVMYDVWFLKGKRKKPEFWVKEGKNVE